MAEKIEWIAVRKFKPEPIGAVGFIGNNAVAIASFFDDADGDQDGTVSTGEWLASKLMFNLSGKALTEVAMQARVQMDILMRDTSIDQIAKGMFVNFAQGLVAQGIYTAYFARGVGLIGGGIASRIGGGMVKQLVIRKGFEAAVKTAFLASMQPAGR
jgi:hypothetical protein